MTPTEIAGVVAAVVTVAAFVQSVWSHHFHQRDKQVHLKVVVSRAALCLDLTQALPLPERVIVVEVRNTGEKAAFVTEVWVDLSATTYSKGPCSYPASARDNRRGARIPPAENAIFYLPVELIRDHFQESVTTVVGRAKDALGGMHQSAPTAVDLDSLK